MCFESSRTAKAKIAKTDIECWKVFRKPISKRQVNFHPIYRSDYTYKVGKIQPVIKLMKGLNNEIHKGYHSYRTYNYAKNSGWFMKEKDNEIKKCIIPKGVTYFSNREGEYVSSTIILLK